MRLNKDHPHQSEFLLTMLKPEPTSNDCIAALSELVKFDTTSRNSNLQLIEFVKNELSAIGIDTRLTFNDEQTKANLWATIGPDIEGGVVLSGHTDVVPVDGQDWSKDPFRLTGKHETPVVPESLTLQAKGLLGLGIGSYRDSEYEKR